MENNVKYDKIEKSQFEFVQYDAKIFDKAPATKPVGYFKDALRRFKKNKASVVAACIILFLVLFSIVTPWFAPFDTEFAETYYKNMPPTISSVSTVQVGEAKYEEHVALAIGYTHFRAVGKTLEQAIADGDFSTLAESRYSEDSPIRSKVKESIFQTPNETRIQYTYKVDAYKNIGFRYMVVSLQEYANMKAWQEETGIPLLYPMPNYSSSQTDPNERAKGNANLWYKHNGEQNPRATVEGEKRGVYEEFEPNYRIAMEKEDGDTVAVIKDWAPQGESAQQRRVRMPIENWFIYKYDTEPTFILGTDAAGRDILVRLAKGVQTSLLLGISITAVCFSIGSVIGAIMGYYGGWVDLGMSEFIRILGGVPGMVVLSLFKIHWINPGLVTAFGALVLYFMMFGWTGDAVAMRNQFYRFKHQEYVLAARTLGARDRRIMFKHILPNSLGTIITGLALAIPGVVGMETTLTYLGILKMDGGGSISVGSMLAAGQPYFTMYPHIIFWPSLVLALLMISFNLFGNGLRDAFNPQLRGVEE